MAFRCDDGEDPASPSSPASWKPLLERGSPEDNGWSVNKATKVLKMAMERLIYVDLPLQNDDVP